MTNGMISIPPSSTFLTNVMIHVFQLQLCMVYTSWSWFGMQELYRGSLLRNKLMVQGFPTVSFADSFPQILWWVQRFHLPIQHVCGQRALWYISYQSLSRSWHNDLDYGLYRLPDLEIRVTADVIGRQGMITPSRYLISPLIYSKVCVHSFSDLNF
jgi:hypothetical protein